MRKTVPFVKYTSLGNNFVILDETSGPLISEREKAEFAYHATNMNFGVGSDNFLVIQRCDAQNLSAIREFRGYWFEIPDPTQAEFIFRMFEPNGNEAFCCGNGLMCISDYLCRVHGINSCRILTEIPAPRPKAIAIGYDLHAKTAWANMGTPRKVPDSLADASIKTPTAGAVEWVNGLAVRFRTHDLLPFTDETMVNINGYLVFTGEPHLVILTGKGFSVSELSEVPFLSPGNNTLASGRNEQRVNFGTWLVNKIGLFFNTRMSHIFPWGINLNFARIVQNGSRVIEYRTFERGINRETYACGTGAVAVAYTFRHLGLIEDNPVDLLPFMAGLQDSGSRLIVEEHHDHWILRGAPKPLFHGEFLLQESAIEIGDIPERPASGNFKRSVFPTTRLSPSAASGI